MQKSGYPSGFGPFIWVSSWSRCSKHEFPWTWCRSNKLESSDSKISTLCISASQLAGFKVDFCFGVFIYFGGLDSNRKKQVLNLRMSGMLQRIFRPGTIFRSRLWRRLLQSIIWNFQMSTMTSIILHWEQNRRSSSWLAVRTIYPIHQVQIEFILSLLLSTSILWVLTVFISSCNS